MRPLTSIFVALATLTPVPAFADVPPGPPIGGVGAGEALIIGSICCMLAVGALSVTLGAVWLMKKNEK